MSCCARISRISQGYGKNLAFVAYPDAKDTKIVSWKACFFALLAAHFSEICFAFAAQMTTAAAATATATATSDATLTPSAAHGCTALCTQIVRDNLNAINMPWLQSSIFNVPCDMQDSAKFELHWSDEKQNKCCFIVNANGHGMLQLRDNVNIVFTRIRSLLLKAVAYVCPEEAILLMSDSECDSECDDCDSAAALVNYMPMSMAHDWISDGPCYYQYERSAAFYGALRPAPVIYPCMDEYDAQSQRGEQFARSIDRYNLEQGNCVLHMMRNGKPILTLKRVVKGGNVMLGLFAAMNIKSHSVLGLYLGNVVKKSQQLDATAEDNGLDQDYIVRHFDTFASGNIQVDEIVPKGEIVAPSKNEAFHLMHFINSCDPQVAGPGEVENCELCPGIGQVLTLVDVMAGDEFVARYGGDYWDKPYDAVAEASDDNDSDYQE